MKGSFIQGVRLFIDHVCWFQMPIPLSVGWTAAGQTEMWSFIGFGLIGQQISDVEVKLATILTLYAWESFFFLMTVLRRLIDNPVWRLCTLVPCILTTLVTGFFQLIGKNIFVVPFFGLGLGISWRPHWRSR